MRIVLLIALLNSCLHSSFADENLPRAASELLQKLNEYSKETLEKAEAEIRFKEVQVIEVLQKRLTEETKAGNLQGALAIRNEIEKLTAAIPAERDEMGEIAPRSHPENDFDFYGKYWRVEGGGDLVWRFFDDGTGLKLFNEKRHEITWSFQDDGTLLAITPIGEEVLSLGRRDRDRFLVMPNGTKRPLKELN